jgi:hypothetical protein
LIRPELKSFLRKEFVGKVNLFEKNRHLELAPRSKGELSDLTLYYF